MITRGIGRLHPDVCDGDRDDGEAFLIEAAQVMDAGQLTRVARALRAKLDPTTPDALARAEGRQHDGRPRFTLPGGNTLIDEALEPWRIGLRRFDPARRPPDDEPA